MKAKEFWFAIIEDNNLVTLVDINYGTEEKALDLLDLYEKKNPEKKFNLFQGTPRKLKKYLKRERSRRLKKMMKYNYQEIKKSIEKIDAENREKKANEEWNKALMELEIKKILYTAWIY